MRGLLDALERKFHLARALRRWRKRVGRMSDRPVPAGPDISQFQGSVNFRQVADAAEFVFVKATEGVTFDDPAFDGARLRAIREAAKAEGLLVGYYHFARPDNNDPRAEARHFVRRVRECGGRLGKRRRLAFLRTELPGVLDYEVADDQGADDGWVAAWVDEYRHVTGHSPIVYGGSVLRERTSKSFGCRLWLAAYVADPDPYVPAAWRAMGWKFWQFTDRGSCPGISGPCDMNRFKGRLRDLIRLAV